MPEDYYKARNDSIDAAKQGFYADFKLSDGSDTYLGYKCTECPIKNSCHHYNSLNPGCGYRRAIFQEKFKDMKAHDADSIIARQRSLLAHFEVELYLLSKSKAGIDRNTINLLQVLLSEYAKVHTQLKGKKVLVEDSRNAPWRDDPYIKDLLAKYEIAKKLNKKELEELQVV